MSCKDIITTIKIKEETIHNLKKTSRKNEIAICSENGLKFLDLIKKYNNYDIQIKNESYLKANIIYNMCVINNNLIAVIA